MIARGEIDKIAAKNKVGAVEIEKDYVITWVLYGISKQQALKSILAFKGGTVLKKVYFKDYRFSEDLDFTLLDEDISNDGILELFEASLQIATEESGLQLEIDYEKEKLHEESGSLKFFINYVAPLQGAMGSRHLKVDVTRGEILEFELEERSVFADYSDFEEEFSILCYSLSEVVIKKMTTLMGRTIPRDVYDLWYLLEIHGMDITHHNFEFERKATNKGRDPKDFQAVFEKKESTFRRDWNKSLANQIHDLPDFNEVVRELNKHFRQL
ncbi:nucleotidyl transferase AbiEii/AbiGii toxin family protein [Wocania ichthyoenteri]|uniref:nucleotidyl transferase AbiEii/AbiGii toxin family protein n=1 Tax=Wocania ichthyoenteri TaxID=1230531 RepID=UPI00053D185F|nr:nucleotidyl transferase AbiEii/AbiGii toxin family protein [Wocania ichthyoenteri]